MKKFNKLVSLMLVGAMMLGMCTTAYAKDESNVKQYNSIQEVLEENESLQDLVLSDENLSRPAMAPLTSNAGYVGEFTRCRRRTYICRPVCYKVGSWRGLVSGYNI